MNTDGPKIRKAALITGKTLKFRDATVADVIDLGGEKVILDSDVADIYGVETKRINEAVKNNPDKFPDGYIIELDKAEWDALKSKFSTSIKGGKVKLPSAFTEKGLGNICGAFWMKHRTDLSR